MGKRSKSVTFRIDNGDWETLQRRAEDERISLNSLVNQILRHNNRWQRNCAAAGFMLIRSAILDRLLDNIDENTLREIAVQSADTYRDSLLLMQGDTGVESAMELLILESRVSGFVCKAVPPDDGVTSNRKKIIIQHGRGAKWSVFLKEYIQMIIHNTGHGVKIDVNPNSVIIEVDIKHAEIAKML